MVIFSREFCLLFFIYGRDFGDGVSRIMFLM